MAFSHLINCLLLAYGPFFVCYKAKNLSEYGAYKVVLFSAAAYLLTAAIKVILLATFLPISAETQEFNVLLEFNKNIFNFIEIVGLYFTLKHRYSYMDNKALRSWAVTIGWGFADIVVSNLFFFILNATGDEFNWKYMVRAATANIEILEVYCLVSLVIYILKNVRKTDVTMSTANIIAFIFGFIKTSIFPTVIAYLLNAGLISEEDHRLPVAKGFMAVTLYILCKGFGAL